MRTPEHLARHGDSEITTPSSRTSLGLENPQVMDFERSTSIFFGEFRLLDGHDHAPVLTDGTALHAGGADPERP